MNHSGPQALVFNTIRPNPMTEFSHSLSRQRVVFGMLLAGFLALSVHSFMLETLNLPYPDKFPRFGPHAFVNSACITLGLVYLHNLWFRGKTKTWPIRFITLFITYAMLREILFRLPIMDGVCTTAWVFSVLENIWRLVNAFILCALVVLFSPRLTTLPRKILASLILAAIVSFLTEPAVDRLSSNMLDHFSSLSHADVYTVPYGWNVQIPAYLTFVEPAIACFVIIYNVWNKLSSRPWIRSLQFIVLIMAIRGVLLSPFINVFYAGRPPLTAIASTGQFSLEGLTLAALTVATFIWARQRAPLIKADATHLQTK